jgi:hypothetical protein
MYSSINSDGTKGLFVSRGTSPWSSTHNKIYDLTTGSLIGTFPPTGYRQSWPEARWDDEDPNTIYYVYGSQLREYDITTGANTLLYDFQTYYTSDTVNYIGMKTIGDYSWDRRYFAFKVHCNGNDGTVDTKKATYIVLWDYSTKSVVASRSVANYNATYYGASDRGASFITMSPSGQYVIFETNPSGIGYMSDVLDHNLNRIAQIKSNGIDLGHCAWGYDWEGNEVIISMGWAGAWPDNVVYTKLSDGTPYYLFGPIADCDSCNGPEYYTRNGAGVYMNTIPTFNPNLKGWVVLLQYARCKDDNGNELEHCWGDKELLLMQVKSDPIVWRVVHNQNCAGTYWFYGRMSFDQEGKKLYFDSNWRSNDNSTLDIYRAELPDEWWEGLGTQGAPNDPPAPSSARTFLTSYNFDNNDASAIAQKYDVVVTSLDEAPAVSTIKATNSQVKTLHYDNALTHGNEYFVYDAVSGKKLINDSWGWYLHDISNPNYRTSLANHIAANLVSNTQFDGVFLDDTWASINPAAFHQEGSSADPILPSDLVDNWETHMTELIQSIKSAIGTKLLILNTGWYMSNYLQLADGQMDENFAHANWEGPTEFLDIASWKNHLNALRNASANSKYYLAQSGVSDGASQQQIDKLVGYTFSSFLMGVQPNNGFAKHYFCPSLNYSNYYWYSNWEANLGNPSGDYFEVPGMTNLYRRDFDNGIVLVNPTDNNLTLQLEKAYYHFDGDPISQPTLSGREGLILFNSPSLDTTPPESPSELTVTVTQ